MAKDIWTGKEPFLRGQKKISIATLKKYMIPLIILILIISVLLFILNNYEPKEEEVVVEDPEEDQSQFDNMTAEEALAFLYGENRTILNPRVDVTLEAGQYSFDPENITVNLNDWVVINLTSIDFNYTFIFPGYFLAAEVSTNQTTTIEFIAHKPGQYIFKAKDQAIDGRVIIVDPDAES